MKKVHCPWCSRDVKVKKGRVSPHLAYGGHRCIGTGQSADRMAALYDLQERRREYASKIGRRTDYDR